MKNLNKEIFTKIALFVTVFVVSATAVNAQTPFSLWGNTTANKVVPNCYMRPEENIILRTVTYNEVCNPRIYEINTAAQNQPASGYYYNQPTQPTFLQSVFSLPQNIFSSFSSVFAPSNYTYQSGYSGYYNNNTTNSFLNNPSYYQTTNTYTPSIKYDSGYYGKQDGYYEDSYYSDSKKGYYIDDSYQYNDPNNQGGYYVEEYYTY